jgi:hypothetical protein
MRSNTSFSVAEVWGQIELTRCLSPWAFTDDTVAQRDEARVPLFPSCRIVMWSDHQ